MMNQQDPQAWIERKKYLAKVLHQIKRDYKAKERGDSLRILEPILESLALSNAANVIENATPSLLMSLRIALQGIALEESEAGVIGVSLNRLIKSMAELVLKGPLRKNDTGSRELFLYLLYAIVIAEISALYCLEETKMTNHIPPKDDRNAQDIQIFGLELVLLMIYQTGVIEAILKHTLVSCGIKDETLTLTTKFLKGCMTLLSILMVGRQDQNTLKTLCINLKAYLRESLADIHKFIASLEEMDSVAELNILIQQAEISLLDEDVDALFTIYTGALGLIESNPEFMRADIEKVEQFAQVIKRAFSTGWMNVNQATVAHLI